MYIHLNINLTGSFLGIKAFKVKPLEKLKFHIEIILLISKSLKI